MGFGDRVPGECRVCGAEDCLTEAGFGEVNCEECGDDNGQIDPRLRED